MGSTCFKQHPQMVILRSKQYFWRCFWRSWRVLSWKLAPQASTGEADGGSPSRFDPKNGLLRSKTDFWRSWGHGFWGVLRCFWRSWGVLRWKLAPQASTGEADGGSPSRFDPKSGLFGGVLRCFWRSWRVLRWKLAPQASTGEADGGSPSRFRGVSRV